MPYSYAAPQLINISKVLEKYNQWYSYCMKSPDSLNLNPDNDTESLVLKNTLLFSNESVEYKGKYKISNWDFEYAEEHYERDVIMLFDKDNDTDCAIDKALNKIRQKLDSLSVSIDWSGPINIQEIVNLYRKHTNDETEKFYTVFEMSGVFSIERLGYEELRDQMLAKTPAHLQYMLDRMIKEAIAQKLDAWKKRHESIEI